ncbi:unnamed protein product [Coccothraustes coccothraustes]
MRSQQPQGSQQAEVTAGSEVTEVPEPRGCRAAQGASSHARSTTVAAAAAVAAVVLTLGQRREDSGGSKSCGTGTGQGTMALALRLFLLLLLAVALSARAAQAAPLPARRADWDQDMDYLEALLGYGLRLLGNAGDEPVGEGDLASQPTTRTEPLGDEQGVSAGRTSPASLLVTAQKPSSHHRGPPVGKYKATGHKKPHEPLKIMRQMLKEMMQAGQEVDGKAVLKAAFPGGSRGSLAASAAGREAMPGTVPGDWDQDMDYLEALLGYGLRLLGNAGDEPVGEGDLASQPTTRTEPLRDGQGVSAGRTSPASLLVTAQKPSSHHRGPRVGKYKATGHKKPHEPLKIMRQMLKEMMQAGQEVDGKAVLKAAFPGGSRGSLAASAAGREAMPGTVPGGNCFRPCPFTPGSHELTRPPSRLSAGRPSQAPLLVPAHKPSSRHRGPPVGKYKATGHKKPHEPLKIMRQMLKEMMQAGQEVDGKAVLKAAFPGGSRGSLAASAAGREAMPGTVPGGAAGPTARVPDSQKGPGKGFCKGTGCWLGLMAGLLFLELIVILCCVQIWNWWKRKQSTSAASQDRPKTSLWDNLTCHLASPCPCPLSLSRLHFQLIAGDSRLPPPPIAGPWLPKGAGPGVQPGQEVQPSCQGRA